MRSLTYSSLLIIILCSCQGSKVEYYLENRLDQSITLELFMYSDNPASSQTRSGILNLTEMEVFALGQEKASTENNSEVSLASRLAQVVDLHRIDSLIIRFEDNTSTTLTINERDSDELNPYHDDCCNVLRVDKNESRIFYIIDQRHLSRAR